MLKQESEIGKT